MKLIESIKRHPYRYATAAIGTLSLAAIETIGYAKNPVYDTPEGSCVSPVAVSETYVNHNASPFLYAHVTGFGPAGVAASGKLPEGAYGVQASFKSPKTDKGVWTEHASGMIQANEAGEFALKMAIGDGEVQFGVRVVAPEGSSACNEIPEIQYTYLDRSEYFDSRAELPWPNPVNVAVNVF